MFKGMPIKGSLDILRSLNSERYIFYSKINSKYLQLRFIRSVIKLKKKHE